MFRCGDKWDGPRRVGRLCRTVWSTSRWFEPEGSWGCPSEGRERGLVLHDVTTGGAAHGPGARGGGGCFGRRTRVRVCGGC